jgi:hypothetical protein
VPLDDLFTAAKLDPIPPLGRDGEAAMHLALVSFEIGEDGPVPAARRHLELLAGGLCVLLESGIEQDSNILSTIAPTSFAGICLTMVPWLLTGGTLVLHHPFDADILARQRRDERCPTLILPGAVAFGLAETGLFAREGSTTLLAAWHAPERLASSANWRERDAALVDVPIFGEAGFVAARRGAGGRPAPISCGPVMAPRDGDDAVMVAELGETETNTVSLRGPMVPRHAFPPGIERSDQPHFAIRRGGLVDSGYGCRVDAVSKTLTVTASPAGVVTVGGYRFALCGLLETIGGIDSGASLAVLPDPWLGQRLVGKAADGAAMQTALNAIGVNPLVALAFAGHGEQEFGEAMAAG